MGNYLSCLVQVLLLTCGPLIAFGVAASLCRSLFIYLVGRERPFQALLTLTLAPSTPMRVLGNAIVAVLFGHRIVDICFLNVRDPDGELGFVERSYNPRNPIALLGNFFYALGPVIVGLLAIFAVLLGTFRDVLPSFVSEIAGLAEGGADFFDYAEATGRVLPAMFRSSGASIWLKALGIVLVLLLCMGVFVSITELVESFSGILLYALLGAGFTGVLMLFDVRVQRIVLGRLHSFAALVTALYLVVFLALAVWLLLGALVFLYRFLFGTGEPVTNAVQEYHEEEYPPERR